MDTAFWRGRRVLVTGHTGFKGAWLAFWLERLGAQVSALALPPEGDGSLYDRLGLARRINGRFLDLRDPGPVRAALAETAPEVVFHLAAQALVRRSYRQPVGTIATNVMGLVHLLEGVRAAGSVRVVVNVTSDKCYENQGLSRGYRESDPMGGHDPYAASKGCAELLSASWRRAFLDPAGIVLATARAGNVIGGGDRGEDRLVPDLIAAFAAGRPGEVRNPEAVRPWQHVLEPLAGYLTLARRLWESPDLPRAVNFGPGPAAEQPVRAVADRLSALWGGGAHWVAPPRPGEPHEAAILRLDAGLAAAALGWTPVWGLEEGLAATVAWEKAALAGADMAEVTAAQIETFTRAAEAKGAP